MANCGYHYNADGVLVIDICTPDPLPLPSTPTLPPPGSTPPPKSNDDIINDLMTFNATRNKCGLLTRTDGTGDRARYVYNEACVPGGSAYNAGIASNSNLCIDGNECLFINKRLPPDPTAELGPDKPIYVDTVPIPSTADTSLAFVSTGVMYQEATRTAEQTVAKRLLPRLLAGLSAPATFLLGVLYPKEIADATRDPILANRLTSQPDIRAIAVRQSRSANKRIITTDFATDFAVRPLSIITPKLAVSAASPTSALLLNDFVVPDAERAPPSRAMAPKVSKNQVRIGSFEDVDSFANDVMTRLLAKKPAPRAPRGVSTKPSLQSIVESIAEPEIQPQPQPQPRGTTTTQDRCVTDKTPRTVCWVTLTKQRRDPTQDTVKQWRKIKCR